jgi:hypothetical protein
MMMPAASSSPSPTATATATTSSYSSSYPRSELFGGDGGEDDGAETLVAGAALRWHDYRAGGRGGGAVEVELTERTAPWNTCALWDVPKLALTGFHLVLEGLHVRPTKIGNAVMAGIGSRQKH